MLPTLRLTCKRLCQVANTPFATSHFIESRHVPSLYSMQALVDITAHPFFGQHITSVIISGFRPDVSARRRVKGSCFWCGEPEPEDCCDLDHVVLGTEQLCSLLDRIFTNIKRFHRSLVVGICAYPKDVCYGARAYKANNRRGWKLTGKSYRLGETLLQVLGSAQRADCDVSRVRVELDEQTLDLQGRLNLDLWTTLNDFFSRIPQPLDLELICGTEGVQGYLEYDRQLSWLYLSNVDSRYSSFNPFRCLGPTFKRLSEGTIESVCLCNCDFSSPRDLEVLFNSSLQTLVLEDVSLCAGEFNKSLWSGFLQRLSGLTGLNAFEIRDVVYRNECRDVGGDDFDLYRFVYPGGTCWVYDEDLTLFHLQFPDGSREFIAEGTDVSSQLKHWLSIWHRWSWLRFKR